MQIINSAHMPDSLDTDEVYWMYNGLDCTITEEVSQAIKARMYPSAKIIYERSLRLQAVILEMQLRGTRIDMAHRETIYNRVKKERDRVQSNFDKLVMEGIGLDHPINPKSHTQVKGLLYDIMGLPEIKTRKANGTYGRSSNRETLEKLRVHFYAVPICNHLLTLRDLNKQMGFLQTNLGEDDRIRCNFNVAGTKTGRLSSSFSDLGEGTNLQNISPAMREIFIPDSGKIFVNIDLEQADSRNVGALCWNLFVESHGEKFAGAYLDACESGDLHTTVASMAYDHVVDRATADEIAYRTLSFRDLAKKLGHGSNYYGQPPTMAKHAKLPTFQVENFQKNYFGAFPCIPAWHEATIKQLQENGFVESPFHRRRYFFDRLDHQDTINSAIAQVPQSMTGDEMNIGMINLYRDPRFEMLIQVHDSILFQCDFRKVNELVPIALKALEAHLTLKKGRDFFVPLEAMTGYNWGYKSKTNPNGLDKYKGEETRLPPKRKRYYKTAKLVECFGETST